MSEAPHARSRGRRFALFVGFILAGLVALTLVFSRDILIAYHLRRLRTEDDYLLAAVTKAETSIEYSAVRRFVRRLDGKRSVYRHLIARLRTMLNEQGKVQTDTRGRTRYVVTVSSGSQFLVHTGATLGIDWFSPRVTAGRITMHRDQDGVRHIGVAVRIVMEDEERRAFVELQEHSSLASLFDLLLDDAFADRGEIELQVHPGILFASYVVRENPETIRTLFWRPAP